MNDDRLLFLAMMVFTFIGELFVLRWRKGRWSLARCILSVAAFSGIIWRIGFIVIHPYNTSDIEPLDSADWICVGLVASIYLLGFMLISLIPAGLTAWVYRKVGLVKAQSNTIALQPFLPALFGRHYYEKMRLLRDGIPRRHPALRHRRPAASAGHSERHHPDATAS